MVSTSVVETYNSLIESLNSRVVYNGLPDRDRFGKILAVTKYFVKKNVNPRAVFAESSNPVVNMGINGAEKLLVEVL
jgi:hypothetical protein